MTKNKHNEQNITENIELMKLYYDASSKFLFPIAAIIIALTIALNNPENSTNLSLKFLRLCFYIMFVIVALSVMITFNELKKYHLKHPTK